MAMAIKPRNVPSILIERIEAAHPAPAYFSADDTVDWPIAVLPTLLKQGVVAGADRARAITCPGCSCQCNKRVVVRKAGGDTSRAFIVCDEEPDLGRIAVPLTSLATYVTSLGALGRFAAGALRIGPPKVSSHLAAYALGNVKGRYGVRPVIIAIEDGQAMLVVGEEREHMAKLLKWIDVDLALDDKLVRRLADRKMESATERRHKAPDRFVQSARKTATRQRDTAIFREAKKLHAQGGETWTNIAEQIAKTELACRLSAERIRRIIHERRGDERKNSRSNSRSRKQLI